MSKQSKENPVPAIEPPCSDCVSVRKESGDPNALCATHAEHYHAHTYGYRREHAFRTHDSNVIPTGVDMSRR